MQRGTTPLSPQPTPTSCFRQVQLETGPSPPAPSALAATPTTYTIACAKLCGAVPPQGAKRTKTGASQLLTTPGMSVQDAASRLMEHRNALECKRLDAALPYKPDAWCSLLCAAELHNRYSIIPHSLRYGFDAGIRPISRTFTPANRLSINQFITEFNQLIQVEFQKGRYIGPVSFKETTFLLRAFVTSPFSIIPKPRQPGKYCLIQNLSSPHSPIQSTTSINSAIDSDQYPCTWGTFATICLLISHLPPGSQAMVCDVKEAYRTIPIKPEQWPGLVVCLQEDDQFAIDTHDCFGLASGGGVYGLMGDAGAQIMHFHGIAPLSKWVDNHIF